MFNVLYCKFKPLRYCNSLGFLLPRNNRGMVIHSFFAFFFAWLDNLIEGFYWPLKSVVLLLLFYDFIIIIAVKNKYKYYIYTIVYKMLSLV